MQIKRSARKAQGLLVRQFAQRLRELRRQRGISQVKLALAAQLHISFIGRLERGDSSATLDTVEAVAKALGVAPAALLSDGPNMDPLPALRTQVRQHVDAALRKADSSALHALAVVSAALAR